MLLSNVTRMLGLTSVVLVVAMPGSATAQRTFSSFTIQEENDALAKAGDDDYTQGLRISLDATRAVLWQRTPLWRDLRDCDRDAGSDAPCRRTTLFIGQNLYAPYPITIATPQPGERPYAAWLYAGLAAKRAGVRRLDTLEVQVGTTGRAAIGEWIQSRWHALPCVGAPQPRGWSHQVRPVPGIVGVVLSWDQKVALEARTDSGRGWIWADVVPGFRAAIGNVHANVQGSAAFRLGYNLQRNWQDRIGPTVLVASRTPTAAAGSRTAWAGVFAAAHTRLVAWNALLQHTTYSPMPSLDTRRAVSDIEAGFEGGWKRLAVGYRLVRRSPEYLGGRTSVFGACFLTYRLSDQ